MRFLPCWHHSNVLEKDRPKEGRCVLLFNSKLMLSYSPLSNPGHLIQKCFTIGTRIIREDKETIKIKEMNKQTIKQQKKRAPYFR